jgi:hypothetical protein
MTMMMMMMMMMMMVMRTVFLPVSGAPFLC